MVSCSSCSVSVWWNDSACVCVSVSNGDEVTTLNPTLDIDVDVVNSASRRDRCNGISTERPFVRDGPRAPSGARGCGVVDGTRTRGLRRDRRKS